VDNERWQWMIANRELFKGIRGTPDEGEPADESEHFYVCPLCGQAVDARDLYIVLHHEQPEHEPLPVS
jgi:hypothetical protein